MPVLVGWDADPAGRASLHVGAARLRFAAIALLRIPSAIVPDGHDILGNPAHPDAAALAAVRVRGRLRDPRLRR